MDSEERPLKKARFLWEVKGKHHLKSQPCRRRNSEDLPRPGTSHRSDSADGTDAASHYSCCIDSFLRRTESMRDGSFLPRTDYEELLPYQAMRGEHARNHYMQEKWQEKRKTLAYIDNIINLVLERYKDPEVPPVATQESMGIEEDAICHAINAHGLQQQQQQDEPMTQAVTQAPQRTGRAACCEHDKGDFMQEAVACAILEKGLTAYGSGL